MSFDTFAELRQLYIEDGMSEEEAEACARAESRRWHCRDCDIDTIAAGEYYTVSEELWASSGLGPEDGMLCLDCLEQRIGRPLIIEDFTGLVPDSWAECDLGSPKRRQWEKREAEDRWREPRSARFDRPSWRG